MTGQLVARITCDQCGEQVTAKALHSLVELRSLLRSRGWSTGREARGAGIARVVDRCRRCTVLAGTPGGG